MNQKTKVAAYARVSTDLTDQLHSLAAQIKYFTEYISQHEDWELVEVYYDEGITGTSVKKRDGFNRMIADCEAGKIRTILTKEVSRFARNTVDTLNYTRQLSRLNVNVIFMNDGIDTADKDGELRLTIMASIAQEESRKISERVKWGMRRKMEDGFVLGTRNMLGFRTENGTLSIVPEEAEIVKRIFNSYVYEGKGCYTIAKELNADGLFSVRGKMWNENGVIRILRNDKYVGDLTQWKHYTTDFLSKQVLPNKGDQPDTPLISFENHHEGIISRDIWNQAQKLIEERGRLTREGRKASSHYWFSGKVFCGKCGFPYVVNGQKEKTNRCLRCVNRNKHGAVHQTDLTGTTAGCDNRAMNVTILCTCMKFLIEHIQLSRESIVTQLMDDIKMMQKADPTPDTEPLKIEIENLSRKKRKAIDLMLDDLLSKEDLKKQTEYYDTEITRLTQEITDKQDVGALHQRQVDALKEYIAKVNLTADHDSEDCNFYGEILKKVIVIDYNHCDVYLNCVPTGFRMTYSIFRYSRGSQYKATIESCEVIS